MRSRNGLSPSKLGTVHGTATYPAAIDDKFGCTMAARSLSVQEVSWLICKLKLERANSRRGQQDDVVHGPHSRPGEERFNMLFSKQLTTWSTEMALL